MAGFLAQALHQIPQLSHLPPGQLRRLGTAAIIKSVATDCPILDRYTTPLFLVIVLFGQVLVLDQHTRIQRFLQSGDWFWVQSRPNYLSLHSQSRTKLYLIPHYNIQKVLSSPRSRLSLKLHALTRSKAFELLVLLMLPALLAVAVTVGLWQGVSFEPTSQPRWVFDLALLPYALGEISFEHDQAASAEAHFRTSLAWNPQYSPAHHALGVMLYQGGVKDAAVAHWYQAIYNDPSFAEAYINLSFALAEQEKLTDAISLMREAIRLSPNDPNLYRVLGDMQLRQNNLLEARRAFLEASRVDQTDASTYYKLGYLYLADKDYIRAMAFFEQALALNPALYLAEQGLGAVGFEQHRADDALRHFNRAIQLYPGDPISYFYTGLIYEQQGQLALAKDAFGQVVQLNPPPDVAERATRHLQRLLASESEVGAMPE